jgi:hypothetical protein
VTLEAVNVSPAGLDLHDEAGEELCPYCNQPITREKLDEIRARIEAEGRERLAEIERELNERFGREIALVEAQKKTEIEKVRKEAAQKAERQVQQLKATQETAIAKAKTEAIAAEQAKAFAQNQKLQEKMAELERQLQRKSANELGEGAEIDLFAVLKREFPGDEITRVRKGEHGADIVHRVVHNGKHCGVILYDSKNSSRWMNSFTSKLRQDAIAGKADHCILSTTAFPAGAPRQIHIREGVIVANPARVTVLAQLLRKQMLQAHALRLTADARNEKTATLYDFITSDGCTRSFDEMGKLIGDIFELEKKSEANTSQIGRGATNWCTDCKTARRASGSRSRG